MSEAHAMYEELSLWHEYIDLMMQLAIEMESSEQIPVVMDSTITALFNSVDDEHYLIDFQHPDKSGRKLVFEFAAYIKDGEL